MTAYIGIMCQNAVTIVAPVDLYIVERRLDEMSSPLLWCCIKAVACLLRGWTEQKVMCEPWSMEAWGEVSFQE